MEFIILYVVCGIISFLMFARVLKNQGFKCLDLGDIIFGGVMSLLGPLSIIALLIITAVYSAVNKGWFSKCVYEFKTKEDTNEST